MRLAYEHSAYFALQGDHRLLPLDQLVPTKPTSSQPDSVRVACERMQLAARGVLARRAPIAIRRRPDGRYDVIDGNATLAVAAASGWPDIPARVL